MASQDSNNNAERGGGGLEVDSNAYPNYEQDFGTFVGFLVTLKRVVHHAQEASSLSIILLQ